jgi:hypothetical protein
VTSLIVCGLEHLKVKINVYIPNLMMIVEISWWFIPIDPRTPISV